MTLDAFCSNLRGVGEGGADLPRAWLASLYEGIKANEIKLKGEGPCLVHASHAL